MDVHVCPWWMGRFIDNPIRRLIHNPVKILSPYVRPGMTALDIGCGMGIFSFGLARLVGEKGKVVSLDLQERMIRAVEKRAARAYLSDRIDARVCRVDSLPIDDLAGRIDFALAFYMVHEVPDMPAFIGEMHGVLAPGGRFLIAEPRAHVSEELFEETLRALTAAGFRIEGNPRIRFSRAVLAGK